MCSGTEAKCRLKFANFGVEEKFTKFSGKRRDAREILCNTTSFWTNFDENWYEIAGGDAAGFLNFGPEVKIRI